MTMLGHLLRLVLFPGLLGALVLGLLVRGVSLWVGAHLARRPAPPCWQPLAEILHLAGREAIAGPGGRPVLVAGAALAGLVAPVWAGSLLPWPRWPGMEALGDEAPAYLLLLAVPPLARLVAAGLSASPAAALGARRLAPLELARLLPLMVAGAALPLFTRQLTLAYSVPPTPASALIGLAVTGLLLATLPWALWDRDEHDGLLAAVGGRLLALFRVVEVLELAAQTGLIAVVLRATGLFPGGQEGLVLPEAAVAVAGVLAFWEAGGRRVLLPEVAQRYTRWAFPAAVVVAALGWWLGRGV